MDADGTLTPEQALHQARDTTAAVHRSGRWRVIGWWVIAAFMTFLLVGDEVFPEFADRWSLVVLGATVVLMGALSMVARVFDRRSRRQEVWFIVCSLIAALVSITLYRWVLPSDVTVWTYIVGASPLAVCAWATVRVLRR